LSTQKKLIFYDRLGKFEFSSYDASAQSFGR
jgi:hypothetical protein